jgi:hypothetical protein
MKILKIVIEAVWFDQILAGKKTSEHRDCSPFWTSRLFDKEGNRRNYDRIEFINGYNKDARRLVTGFGGFTTRNDKYHIKIGKIYK